MLCDIHGNRLSESRSKALYYSHAEYLAYFNTVNPSMANVNYKDPAFQ